MGKRLVDRIPFAKILTVLAVTFGVSLGLCGLTFAYGSGGGGNSGTILVGMGILELAAMALSAAGLVLTAAAWGILAAVGSFSRNRAQPEELPDGKREEKRDEEQ